VLVSCSSDTERATPSDAAPSTLVASQDASIAMDDALARAVRREQSRGGANAIPLDRIRPEILDLIPDVARLAGTPHTAADRSIEAQVELDAASLADLLHRDLPAANDHPPTLDESERALRLYARGRLELAANDAAKAGETFRAAASLDPAQAAIWSALGSASEAAGRSLDAWQAHRRAAALGSDALDVLVPLALGAIERRDAALARGAASSALRSDALRGDPVAENVLWLALADAYAIDQEPALEADALSRAFDTPSTIAAPTRFMPAYTALLRRRLPSLQRLGDLFLATGRPIDALSVYQPLSLTPGADPAAILPRRVAACLATGWPASACAEVLSDIARAPERVGDRHLQLLRVTARGATYAEGVARTLADLRSALSPPAPTTWAALVRTEAAVLPDRRAIEVLTGALVRDPWRDAFARDLLSAVEDPAAQLRAARDAADQQPLAIPALARTIASHPRRADLFARLDRTGPSPLAAGVLIERDRPHDALAMLDELDRASPAQGVLSDASLQLGALRARALFIEGRWNEARPIVERMMRDARPENASDQARRVGLAALQAALATQADADADAARAAEQLSTTSGDPMERAHVLLESARAAARLREGDRAEAKFQQVLAFDPANEDAWEGLIQLADANGPKPSREMLQRRVRQLNDALPSSKLIAHLRVQELAQLGLLPQAEESARDAIDRFGPDRELLSGLLQLWSQFQKSDPAVVQRGEQWLAERAERSGHDPLLSEALARTLLLLDRPDDAIAEIDAALAIEPAANLSETREFVLRLRLNRSLEADHEELARLYDAPQSIENRLRLARALARQRGPDEALSALEPSWPDWVTLREPQHELLEGVLTDTAARLQADTGSMPAERVDSELRLMDACIARGATPPLSLMLVRAQASMRLPPSDTERTILAIRDAAEASGERRSAVYLSFARDMVRRERGKAALSLFRMGIDADPAPSNELFLNLMQLSWQFGSANDCIESMNTIPNAESLRAVAERVTQDPLPAEIDEPGLKAELAYVSAGALLSRNLDDDAIALYELALRLSPEHAGVLNDFGYMLIERRERVSEAESMLVRAVRAAPSNNSYLDSLGWLRYLQGQLNDADPDLGSRGALFLLDQAASLNGGSSSPVIAEHYGDALWRAGHQDNAVAAWERAIARARSGLASVSRDSNAAAHLQGVLDSVRAKITEARRGGHPAVAPTYAEMDEPAP
jgi:Flp pilus assembly protein TadD